MATLLEASRNGYLDHLKLFITQGADLSQGDGREPETGLFYDTPLSGAAESGRLDVCLVLLDAGAPIEQRVNGHFARGETALLHALRGGHTKVVRLLLDRGASAAVVTDFGGPLHYALNSIGGTNVTPRVRLLLEAGADPAAIDKEGHTALDSVARLLSAGPRYLGFSHLSLLEALPLFVAKGGAEGEKAVRLLADLNAQLEKAKKSPKSRFGRLLQLLPPGSLEGKDLAKAIEPHLAPLPGGNAAVTFVCRGVLSHPALAQAPGFADVVRRITRLSKKLKNPHDDHGGLDDYAERHLYTFDAVLELLALPAVLRRSDWADLVCDVCEAKLACVKEMSFADEEMVALIAAAAGHADLQRVTQAAKAAHFRQH